MKKYLIGLAALLVVVTGCGNKGKELTCTLEEDDQKMVVEMNFGKDDVIDKMTMTMTMKFEQELTKEELASIQPYIDSMCDSYPHEEVDCKINTDTKGAEIIVVYDIENMSEEAKKDLGYSDEEGKFDVMKKAIEEDGYTCK